MTRIAINGLGRIGRSLLKLALDQPKVQVVAVNDIADPEALVYLLQRDTVYGRYSKPVSLCRADGQLHLCVADRRMLLLTELAPNRLPWRALGVDVAVEATGAFASYSAARRHLDAGAGHVVISAPAKDEEGDDARTVLMGVNPQDLRVSRVSSNGSCTTNSAAAIMDVLRASLGVRKAMLNTVHGYTASQTLTDSSVRGSDLRRGRAAAVNIVPSTTGAASAVARAIPQLRHRFDGIAFRVPVPAGSISSLVVLTGRATTVAEVNGLLQSAAQDPHRQGVLATTSDPLVSSDIIGDPHGAIVDLSLTRVVDGDLCAIYSWYDNEFGFANTLLAHVVEAGR